MQTKKLIIGNWKMEVFDHGQATTIAEKIKNGLSDDTDTQVVICPAMVHIGLIQSDTPKMALGAQDCSAYEVGAYTGQTAAKQLYNLGVRYVIIGHSERRALGETNEVVSAKISQALAVGLTPVVCVGEADRARGDHVEQVTTQLRESLAGVPVQGLAQLVIAYEPIWAIGAQAERPCTPVECEEMMAALRAVMEQEFSLPPEKITIIYGGSVNRDNAHGFLDTGMADGLLPGRASVDPEHFLDLIHIADGCK